MAKKTKQRLPLYVPPWIFAEHEDDNERFFNSMCSVYLGRLMQNRAAADAPLIEIIIKVLGPDAEALPALLAEMHSQKAREKLLDYFEKDNGDIEDIDDFARAVRGVLQHGSRSDMRRFVRECSSLLKKKAGELPKSGTDIEDKMQAVRDMFHLTEAEAQLCLFGFITTVYSPAEEYFDGHLGCFSFSGRKYLTKVLNIGARTLAAALGGTLEKTGVMEADKNSISFDDEFISFFIKNSPEYIQEHLYRKVQGETLPLEYHMLEQHKLDYILQLLQNKPETSTHILLFGKAGVGKTSFARGAAQALGVPAYEISKPDEKNDLSSRRAALIASLNMTNTGGQGSIIIIDEADSLLNTEASGFFFFFCSSGRETADKAWLNYFMDRPGARVIWIANDISGIDPSVMRRFAYSMKFSHFNRQQRVNLWNRVLERHGSGSLLTAEQVDELAARYRVSAGAVDMAVRKGAEVAGGNAGSFLQAVRLGLDAHRALINGGIAPAEKEAIERLYSLEGLNINGNISSVIKQAEAYDRYLKQPAPGTPIIMNMLLYGPPGTGKSEFARYLAHHLGRELMVRRASDIIDCFVGVTEQNIAAAFSDAEEQGAVLVIDEADSFIFTRDIAQRSWETSHVNEFLTQMERFRGFLICTTNRVRGIDSASVRRFNLKIGFDFLTVSGAAVFYELLLQPLAGSLPGDRHRKELQEIRDLAPGDFKVVRDRYCLYPADEISHDRLIQALAEEASIKRMQSGAAPVGFNR